jgi:WD40 repeat protein
VSNIPHSGSVHSVAFSPDGTRVLSGSYDKTLKLWDAVSGELIRTFERHPGWVLSVGFSPDGARVLSGGGDGTIRLWVAATGPLLRFFGGHSYGVTSVAFSPEGARARLREQACFCGSAVAGWPLIAVESETTWCFAL